MIWTNISCIGDFFLLWPVASAYYKEIGDTIHWVLTKNYYMYPIIEDILYQQNFTKHVSLVDVGVDAWDENQWRFDPAQFGIYGPYLNFGFTQKMHGKYIPDFYASLYGLNVDNNYCIQILEYPALSPFEKVTIRVDSKPELWRVWKQMMPNDITDLAELTYTSFAMKLWYSAKASERHFGCSSSAVLMDLMNLPCTIYSHPSLGDPKLYYRNSFHKIVYP